MCHKGADCEYLHRLPGIHDLFQPNTDCFGRLVGLFSAEELVRLDSNSCTERSIRIIAMIWAVLEASSVCTVKDQKHSTQVADKLLGQNRVLYVGRIHVTDDIGTGLRKCIHATCY